MLATYDSEDIQRLHAVVEDRRFHVAFHRAMRGILLIISRVIELLNDVKVETLQSEIATEVSFILRPTVLSSCRTRHSFPETYICFFFLHTENRLYPHNSLLQLFSRVDVLPSFLHARSSRFVIPIPGFSFAATR